MAKPSSGTSVNPSSPYATGLVASWALLEGSGTTSADGSGNGHTLTGIGSNNTAWGTSGSDIAITNTSASSPGVAITSGPTLSGSGSWSVAFRAHQTSSGTNGMVAGHGAANKDYLWFQGGTNFTFSDESPTNNAFSGVTLFTSDADYLLVHNFSAHQLHLYKDGSEVSGSPIAASALGDPHMTLILSELLSGYLSGSPNFALVGSLTYFHAWSVALNSTDASNLHTDPYTMYRSTSPTLTLTGPTSGVVNVASTNFTVTPSATVTSDTVTPATSGTGTFSPTSLTFTSSSTPQTFTYTPTTTAGSPHSISITDSAGLTISGSPISYAVSAGSITISSPIANQFFWRGSSGSKTFAVSGTYTGGSGAIQWSTDNATWSTLVASPTGGTFSGNVTLGTGQYTIYLRFAGATSVTANVTPVSVAYVIAIGGQSNASGRGTNNQVVYDLSGLSLTHGLLTGVTGSGPYTPSSFAVLADPYGTSVDAGSAGSWIPPFVSALSGILKAPIGIIPTAVGGTSIATDWAPAGATYLQCVHHISAIGGCDFMAFWLGETDSAAGMSQATFHTDLAAMVAAFWTATSAPVLMCQLQTFTAATGPQQAAINAAIAQGAGSTPGTASGDIAHLYAGPILAAIPTAPEDANHLKTDAKVCTAGGAWADVASKAFFLSGGGGNTYIFGSEG